MKLNVAVQMDPIERINIRGEFDLRAAAARRKKKNAGPRACPYYTPDPNSRCAARKLVGPGSIAHRAR